MRIRAVRVRGAPPDAPLQADFGSQGGRIGRGSDCTLVLPDPYKHVSRTHAEIAEVDGRWLLTDRGSANPVMRNGQEVGRDRQVPLADGDLLVIGDYELQVETRPLPAGASAAAAAPAALPPTQFWNSLLPESAGSNAAGNDPLADLLSKSGFEHGTPSVTSIASGPDPFAIDPKTQIRQAGGDIERDFPMRDPGGGQTATGANTTQPLEAAGSESLDALFDLNPSGSARPDTPSPGHFVPDARGSVSSSVDPFEALGWSRSPPAPPAPASDHVPGWQESFPLPAARRSAGQDTMAGVPLHLSEAPPAGQGTEIRSPAPSSPATAAAVPLAKPARNPTPPPVSTEQLREIVNEAANAHAASFAPLPETRPTERIEEINRRNATAAAQQSSSDATGSPDALLAQLLVGLQMPGLPRALGDKAGAAALDPRLMRRLGELLRLSLQGTLALLAARATVKQEMRAELTVIADRGNNPLKFSPDVLSALTHLLSPQPMRGFMDPAAAVRDAHDDLLAHQLASVAATRAAMQQLLERFDPARLEARLSGNRRMLDALVPGTRKARLWELFNELFEEISREAEDDFEAVFGKAFRTAYEEQVRRLRETREESQ